MTKRPAGGKTPELDIAERAAMFQAIVEMGEVGILVLDEQNRVEFANRMVMPILGYESHELVGKKFTDLLDEENKKLFYTLKIIAFSLVAFWLGLWFKKGIKSVSWSIEKQRD